MMHQLSRLSIMSMILLMVPIEANAASSDWQTGQTKYELKDLTTGAAVFADDQLYCLDEKGTAALVKPHSDHFEITGQFRLTQDKVKDAWAHPVVHKGRLYLRYHDTLWCYDVRQ